MEEQDSKYFNIIDFYYSYDDNLILYIKGHLFLEYAMNLIYSKATGLDVSEHSFYQKIHLLSNKNLITNNEKILLLTINRCRNKIAHDLDYDLTFDTAYDLVCLSVKAGVDYFDDNIYKDKLISQKEYGIEGIINELFPNTFCQLIDNNKKYFTMEEISKLMC